MAKKKILTDNIEELALQELKRAEEDVVVMTDYENQILSLAEKNNIPQVDLVTEYEKNYQELSAKGVTTNIETLAMNAVKNMVRKITKPKNDSFVSKQKAESVVLFVIGDTGSSDQIEIMKSIAKAYSNKWGLAAAVKEGYINKENQVLDNREKVFGKPNGNFGKPLKESQHERKRVLDIIGRIGDSQVWKDGLFNTSDNKLAVGWGKVKMFTLAQTFGIVKANTPIPLTEEQRGSMSEEDITSYEKQLGHILLNSSNAEDTQSIFRALHEPVDIDQVFMQVVEPQLKQVDDVEAEYTYLPVDAKGKVPYNNRFFVKGTVSWINRDRPDFNGAISLGLWNPETGAELTLKIPQHVQIDFGENSDVIVIGKLERGDLRVEAEESNGKATYVKGQGAVRMVATGLYKIANMCTPSDTASSETLGEESEINGWVE
jgi:hypothetical protein